MRRPPRRERVQGEGGRRRGGGRRREARRRGGDGGGERGAVHAHHLRDRIGGGATGPVRRAQRAPADAHLARVRVRGQAGGGRGATRRVRAGGLQRGSEWRAGG